MRFGDFSNAKENSQDAGVPSMNKQVWLPLTPQERALLQDALNTYSHYNTNAETTQRLTAKLSSLVSHPDITIGVYGGQVQWTKGNPFPIRVRDYDGERSDLPDVDEYGDRCRVWYEPTDTKS